MSENPFQAPPVMAEVRTPGRLDVDTHSLVLPLQRTKPWVRFVSVLLFIATAILVAGGLALVLGGTFVGGYFTEVSLGIAYLIGSIFYLVPGIFLWKYASGIGEFLREPTLEHLSRALRSQASYWRFVGVVLLILSVLYAVLAVIAVAMIAAAGPSS